MRYQQGGGHIFGYDMDFDQYDYGLDALARNPESWRAVMPNHLKNTPPPKVINILPHYDEIKHAIPKDAYHRLSDTIIPHGWSEQEFKIFEAPQGDCANLAYEHAFLRKIYRHAADAGNNVAETLYNDLSDNVANDWFGMQEQAKKEVRSNRGWFSYVGFRLSNI